MFDLLQEAYKSNNLPYNREELLKIALELKTNILAQGRPTAELIDSVISEHIKIKLQEHQTYLSSALHYAYDHSIAIIVIIGTAVLISTIIYWREEIFTYNRINQLEQNIIDLKNETRVDLRNLERNAIKKILTKYKDISRDVKVEIQDINTTFARRDLTLLTEHTEKITAHGKRIVECAKALGISHDD